MRLIEWFRYLPKTWMRVGTLAIDLFLWCSFVHRYQLFTLCDIGNVRRIRSWVIGRHESLGLWHHNSVHS